MRVVAAATVLLLSSSIVTHSFAKNAPAPSQSQNTPVQPEGTPQQSEQTREQDQKRNEDVHVGRDWQARHSDDLGDRPAGRAHYDRNDPTVGRSSRMERDDELDRGDRDWDRRDRWSDFREHARRRVKTCIEYENGDEYCRYR